MKTQKTTLVLLVIAAFLLGFIASGITSPKLPAQPAKTALDLAKEYYSTELMMLQSPTELTDRMLANGTDFLVVDVRDNASYAAGHVKGAINIPESQIDSRYTTLPRDKDIIIYCWATDCMLSRRAGLRFAELGVFVKEMNVGWEEWKAYGYPMEGSNVTSTGTSPTCSSTSETC